MRTFYLVAAVAFIASGCFLRPEEEQYTYPPALDAELVGLYDLLYTVAVPDTYNVKVYVYSISECPPEWICEVPDHIAVSEHPDPDSGDVATMIFAQRPSQFDVGARYLMSIAVQKARDDFPPHRLRLLGSSEVR